MAHAPTVAASLPTLDTVSLTHAPADTIVADSGVRLDPLGRLVFPIILASSCEGEDCETSFRGLACGDALLRASPSLNAPAVARILRGDTVNVRRTDLHVRRPGIVVLKRDHVVDSDVPSDGVGERIPRRDTLRFAAGDTVYLLQYASLGSWKWWHRGHTSFGDEFWAGPATGGLGGKTESGDSSIAVARSQPIIEGWWLIVRRNGDVGWWHRDSLETVRSIFQMEHWENYCPLSFQR